MPPPPPPLPPPPPPLRWLRPRMRFIFIRLPSRFPIASPGWEGPGGADHPAGIPGALPAARHCFIGVGSGLCPFPDATPSQQMAADLTRAPGTNRNAAVPTTRRKLALTTLAAKRFFCGTGLRREPAYRHDRKIKARSIPARSGYRVVANPCASASAATSGAWSLPSSSTATAPGASRAGRLGTIAR
jgi:hypothetical protein